MFLSMFQNIYLECIVIRLMKIALKEGMLKVKKILAENYVRPDEAEKVKSKIREIGVYNVIDKVNCCLNEKKDRYEGHLSNLGVSNMKFIKTI